MPGLTTVLFVVLQMEGIIACSWWWLVPAWCIAFCFSVMLRMLIKYAKEKVEAEL